MARVLLGVGGGIAAYKSVLLARMLAETGHQVRVIPTRAGLKFVGAATFEAITGEPAIAEIFEGSGTEHIELAGDADVIIVAPATANLMARIAAGMADDLLTAVVLATSAPVWMAPAMHTGMWLNPATQANVATLSARGVQFIGPAEGRLAGSDSGLGRMSEPETIRAAVFDAHDDAPLAGTSALVTAGGTREAVDPVRFLGNASSGLQGIEIARALQRAGAQVTLIAANTELPSPPGVERITVTSAEEMRTAVLAQREGRAAIVHAAAVADFRPAEVSARKIKRGERDELVLRLVRTPDILREMVQLRSPGQLICAFAAETADDDETARELGRAKAMAKGADLTVVNRVGEGLGIGMADNSVWVFDGGGREVARAAGSKAEVAETIVSVLCARVADHGESDV